MIGQTVSHYKITEKLGGGGMGVVYKAQDLKLDRFVALKFLPPSFSFDEEAKQRFIHEAKAASSLDHPNICTIHEIGETKDEQLFIAMSYYEGETLEQKSKDGMLEIDEIINVALQTAAGLNKAHQKGIIHRDIKPANILIKNDGIVKILDFGLAKVSGYTKLTQTGSQSGTISYMSPEQTIGSDVDYRTDIWSLGVVLYEMLTGKTPFKGDYEQAVIYSILNDEPESIVSINPKVLQQLENIVLKTLRRKANERYQKLEELILELKQFDKGDQRTFSEEKTAHSLPSFFEVENIVEFESPICVGREKELKKLESYFEQMLTGMGKVVFVTGEAGSGKTTLIKTFQKLAQEKNDDLIVTEGKCDAQTGVGDQYLAFRDVINSLTGDIEAKWSIGTISKDHATRIWNFFPSSVQAILDKGKDLIDTFIPLNILTKRAESYTKIRESWKAKLDDLAEHKDKVQSNSDLKQSDLLEQYTKVMQSLSKEKPLLLVLDDLQWADAGSINLLFHLGRRLDGYRILILGSYRPTDVKMGRYLTGMGIKERHPLEPLIYEFKRIFDDNELNLGQSEGRKFIEELLDREPNKLDDEFKKTLFNLTEGNALFTVELLHNMKENNELVIDEDGKWIERSELNWEKLPVRIDAVIGERINRLPDNLKEILSYASLEGEEFTAEIVAELCKIDTRDLIHILSNDLDKHYNLVKAQGLIRINGKRLSKYRFRHVLYQKYLYNLHDGIERIYIHEDIGNALEKLCEENIDDIAVQLAWHFSKADISEKAVKYLMLAAEQAKRVYANEETIEHFQHALQLIMKSSRNEEENHKNNKLIIKIYEGLGDVKEMMGKHDEARKYFQEALPYLDNSDIISLSKLHYKIGTILIVQRNFKDASETFLLAESVLGSVPVEPKNEWWFRCLEIQFSRISLHYWQDQLSEMTELTEKMKPAVEENANTSQLAKYYNSLSLLAFRRDGYIISDETLAHARAGLSASSETKNLKSISSSQFLLGFTLLWKGELHEAEVQFIEALKLSEQTGNITIQSRCLTYLTLVYRKLEEIEKVREYIPRCEEIASSGQMVEYIAQAKANRAWLAWKEGNYSDAETLGKTAIELWDPVIQSGHASASIQWTALWPLVCVSLKLEKIEDGIGYVHKILEPRQVPKLHESLKVILEKSIKSWEKNDRKKTIEQLIKAIELAQKNKYL